jgi:hypothetical protein
MPGNEQFAYIAGAVDMAVQVDEARRAASWTGITIPRALRDARSRRLQPVPAEQSVSTSPPFTLPKFRPSLG